MPEAKPENQGWLTYIYPSVDVFDGQQLLRFNEQAKVITLEDGTAYRSAGVGTLWAKLARIVIEDGLVLFMLTGGHSTRDPDGRLEADTAYGSRSSTSCDRANQRIGSDGDR